MNRCAATGFTGCGGQLCCACHPGVNPPRKRETAYAKFQDRMTMQKNLYSIHLCKYIIYIYTYYYTTTKVLPLVLPTRLPGFLQPHTRLLLQLQRIMRSHEGTWNIRCGPGSGAPAAQSAALRPRSRSHSSWTSTGDHNLASVWISSHRFA